MSGKANIKDKYNSHRGMNYMTLMEKAIKGATWTGISSITLSILSLIQTLVVSSMLGPKSLGIISILMVVIGFSQMLYDMGLSNAIIQKKDVKIKELSSLFWTNVFIGILIYFIILVIKDFIASFYSIPEISVLLSLYSLVFVIIPFGQQYEILLKKELRFNTIAKIEVTSNIIGMGIAIVLLILGVGLVSVPIGYLIIFIIKTCSLIINGWKSWRPELMFNFSHLKKYLNFGLFQMGENVVNYFGKNLDFLIIGKVLSTVELGYYTLAYNIVMVPVSKINPIVTKVLFPLFSRIQDNTLQIKKGYLKMIDFVAIVNFPIYLGIIAMAPGFINIFMGQEWVPSLIYFQLLAFLGLIRTLENPIGTVLLAKGKANYAFYFNLIKVIIMVPLLILSAKLFGGVGITISLIFIQLLSFITSLFLLKILIDLTIKDYVHTIKIPIYINIIMFLAVIGVGVLLDNGILRFIFQITLGILLYFLLLYKFHNWPFSVLKKIRTK